MELRQLRYFVAVADTLNFSRAAESLFVSQSALSKQISDLERELGALLFRRSKHNVELTEAGKLLLDEAKAILLRTEKLSPLLQETSDTFQDQERSVFIGVDAKVDIDPSIHQVLAETVYRQRQASPGLRALFFRRSFSELHQAILSGKLDLGLFLSSEPTVDKSLEHCLLSHDEMVLILRSDEPLADDPATVRQLLNTRGLVMTRRELPELSHVVRILNEIGCTPQIRYTEDRTSVLLNIESGDGLAILPRSGVQSLHNPHIRLLSLHTDFARLYLLAAWRRGGSPLAKQIVLETRKHIELMRQSHS